MYFNKVEIHIEYVLTCILPQMSLLLINAISTAASSYSESDWISF